MVFVFVFSLRFFDAVREFLENFNVVCCWMECKMFAFFTETNKIEQNENAVENLYWRWCIFTWVLIFLHFLFNFWFSVTEKNFYFQLSRAFFDEMQKILLKSFYSPLSLLLFYCVWLNEPLSGYESSQIFSISKPPLYKPPNFQCVIIAIFIIKAKWKTFLALDDIEWFSNLWDYFFLDIFRRCWDEKWSSNKMIKVFV